MKVFKNFFTVVAAFRMIQSNKYLSCIIAVPWGTSMPNYKNRPSMVSEIWELMVHGEHKVMASLHGTKIV